MTSSAKWFAAPKSVYLFFCRVAYEVFHKL
jgi:hypothetical protein